MSEKRILRFASNGPGNAGLSEWETGADCDTPPKQFTQYGHEYFASPDGQLKAGVWEAAAFVDITDSYSCDEFCYILEGEVTITDGSGVPEIFRAGEAFFIPKGMKCRWEQTSKVRKYYVIINSDSE